MSVRLVLALHFHQPVGNFDSVFRDAVRLCYGPIVDHFERHPTVRAAFHLSGCLLEWLEAHDRAFVDRIVRLVGSGQIEPLGGGFYEPILTVIPRDDALEQLARLSAYWEKRGGVKPTGAWLPERVWEPSLAELLSSAGIRFTILDDQHLRFSGLVRERMTGVFVTERFGKAVGFFPSDFQLRYLIPFRTIDKVRDHFSELARGEGETIVTYGDDAEKFGLWPGTNQWVFGEGWLEKFFGYLGEPDAPVRTQLPGEIFRNHPPATKVYVPNASYSEMLEWALPAESVPEYVKVRDQARKTGSDDAVRSFVRGSLWDMFLSRYPESDQTLKHVIRTSRRVRAMKAGKERDRALTSVLRAECNCPYWHGLFGGIYLPHLRHGVQRQLLEADAALLTGLKNRVLIESEDYDGDLETEVVVASRNLQAFFRPSDGGTMAELDFLPARFNLANVVSRWQESYHAGEDITHEHETSSGLPSPHEVSVAIRSADLKNLFFDRLPIRSLRDFISAEPLDVRRLRTFEGMEFAAGRMIEWREEERGWSGEQRIGSWFLRKRVEVPEADTLAVSYSSDSPPRETGYFGTILAFTLLTPDAPDRRAEIAGADGLLWRGKPGDEVALDGVRRLTWEDSAAGIAFDLTMPQETRVVTTPIRTLQRSEKGYEAVYQGTLIALSWPATFVSADHSARVELKFRSVGKRGGKDV